MIRWSRPEKYNMTHDYARHMMLAGKTHYNPMEFFIDLCLTTQERGLVLKQHGGWGEISMDYEF